MIHALKEVVKGERYLCDEALSIIVGSEGESKNGSDPSELTDRELEVLEYICKEMTNRDIAKQLHISVRTVDAHRHNLLQKTAAQNTAGLVKYAIRHQIFTL